MNKFRILFYACIAISMQAMSQNKPSLYADGLIRSTPETEGVHSDGITRFVQSVEKKQIRLHSFMLLRHGKVVAEAWWNPYRQDARHIMYSVSKTFTSIATGFAIQEKKLSLNDKVISFFPEYKDVYNENSFVKELTIRNLLTMTAGKEPFADFRLRDIDWIKAILGAHQDTNLKDKFEYNSYACYLLSAILQRATGKNVRDYLKPRLFEPLGITGVEREQSPAGIDCGGWGMSVKTSDMAKVGQLLLQKGKWKNRQLLPVSWIEESTTKQIETAPNSTESEKAQSDWAQGYGYLLWQCRNQAFRADGSFGQFIIVMPQQDAVMAITANENDMQRELQEVWDNILPAFSATKLPADKKAYQTLTHTLNHLALPTLFKSTESNPARPRLSNTYTIESNDQDIRNISLNMDDDSCRLIIRTNTATHTLVSGNDSWKTFLTDKNSPYYNERYRNPIGLSPYTVSGYAIRQSPCRLSLFFEYLEDSSNETYDITFDGRRIILLLSSSEDPKGLPIRLVGHCCP